MRKVIDGLIYDTATAKRIAHYDNDLNTSDFGWVDEDLYLTANNRWFVDGEGGPATQYAVECGNNSKEGSRELRALTAEEAYEWLEACGTDEATSMIETYFADRIAPA